MTKQLIINPKYIYLESFIECIPNEFEHFGEAVYKARNELKSYNAENTSIIVKSYKKPHFINRIAYTFFRQSKAKRAYDYALRLLELGIQSPEPIAYIITKSKGLIEKSYFISVFEKDYLDVRNYMSGDEKDENLLKSMARYIAYFHNKGVLHLDMSPGNILFKKCGNEFVFTLIDINRMMFLPTVSNEKRFKSFKRLSNNKEVLTEIAKEYAIAANIDESLAIKEIDRFNYAFFNSRKVKNRK